MKHLHIDIETFSGLDIKEVGAHKYARDPAFKILLIAIQWNDQPVRCYDLTAGEDIDDVTFAALTDPDVLKIAHNAQFELLCLEIYYGIDLDPAQWYCTMVGAAQLGLPMGLGEVAEVLGLPEQKALRGKALIRYFCMPVKTPKKKDSYRKINLPQHAPDDWNEFKEYNKQDVRTESAIFGYLMRLPKQPKVERVVYWKHDFIINGRGVRVDIPFIEKAIEANTEFVNEVGAAICKLTGVDNPNSLQQLRKWVAQETGIHWTAVKFDKAAVSDAIDGGLLDEHVEKLYRLRQAASKTSVSKYDAMLRYACKDDRIRGTIQYYGAGRTGRYAGRGVQVHNLKRTPKKDIDVMREDVLNGAARFFYEDVSDVVSMLVRTAIVPKPGYSLIPCDFSAIEARVTAWLANERWRLQAFKDDTDIYVLSYSKMFDIPIDMVGPDGRQKGKVSELALGYQGADGALITMGALRDGLTVEELPEIVAAWREASPNIVKLWKSVEYHAKTAVRDKTTLTLRLHYTDITFRYDRGYLFIVLPSGRFLSYYGAGIADEPEVMGGKRQRRGCLYYYGMNDKNQWVKIPTYGGSLVENIVQAIARDLLAWSMWEMEKERINVVMHVHDEIVAEEPDADAREVLELMQEIMSDKPNWAKGLPLKGVGFITKFYKKD